MNILELEQRLQAALSDHKAGRFQQAEALYRQVLSSYPDHADAMHLLGVLASQTGQSDIALQLIRRATELNPSNPRYQVNLGRILAANGDLTGAIDAYCRSLESESRPAETWYNLGNVLHRAGQFKKAVTAFREALARNPNNADAWNNLGNSLHSLTDYEQAITAFQRATQLQPEACEMYSNLGDCLRRLSRLDEAAAACEKAISLCPDVAAAYNNLGIVRQHQGQLDAALDCFRQAIAIDPAWPVPHGNLLSTLHYIVRERPQTLYSEHRAWSQRHAEPLQRLARPHTNDRSPDRRLRVGYVSGDFLERAVGRFVLPLLENHDRNQVQVACFSDVRTPTTFTAQLCASADEWHQVAGQNDEQLAQFIREQRIDILVDLSMHTELNRLLVFARKPTPVQITYLAYCSTTGLDAIDYRLSDPYLDPPGSSEEFYSETTIRLPKTYWCYRPPFETPAVGPLPAQSAGHITFGCLNSFFKVNDDVLRTWCRMLRALPGSKVVLHAMEGQHRQRVKNLFEREGVDPQRLQFVGYLPIREYIQLYQGIDIALDPFPFNGGTTTCDALWMGVPVVSLAGAIPVARAGLSLLSNIGLQEFVAMSEDDYVRIAIDLANQQSQLAELRGTMRRRMQSSPLMDAAGFARDLEDVYRQMWKVWCESREATT